MGIPWSRSYQRNNGFTFAFNNDSFSDRVLRIEILENGFEAERSIDDHEQTAEKRESNVLSVKTVNVSSVILAAKSPFFLKIFSNGMKESKEREVTLKIHAYEETAFMDLLNYIYTNTLPKRTTSELLELLLVADKFEVASCINCCGELLSSLPLTYEFASLILNLPTSLSKTEVFQPLVESSKELFCKSLDRLDDFPDEIENMDESLIETILSSDDVKMNSEDTAYDFLMKWVTSHFSDPGSRRQFLHSQACKLIRFPYVSPSKLKHFSNSNYVDDDFAANIILESLFYKLEILSKERALEKAELRSTKDLLYAKRQYVHRRVRIMELDTPYKQSIVFWDLKKEECRDLGERGTIRSETFYVGKQTFYLAVHRKLDKNKNPILGLRLHREPGQRIVTVAYEFSVRKKPNNKFESKGRKNCMFSRRNSSSGLDDLFGVKWDELMAENSQFFINGSVYLMADVLIKYV